MIYSLLITIIVLALSVVLIMTVMSVRRKVGKSGARQKIQKKGKNVALKEAQKKLARDPKNVTALRIVGELYYEDKDWEKTLAAYKTLYDLSSSNLDIDIAKATLRMGEAAFNLGNMEEAVASLVTSVKRAPESFECNFYLGRALCNIGEFDKACACLRKAKVLSPENTEVNGVLGICLFKAKKYKDALPFLRQAVEEKPGDKELMFSMAISMTECGLGDKALKLFMHLRPDPQFGAESCLEAGKLHERIKDYNSAVQDYEIAQKLENVPEQTALQIKYRYALTCIAMSDISKGFALLKQIQAQKAGYKDVDTLIARYSELNQNKNLQIYLMSGTSDFCTLCRKFIAVYHKDNFVKIEDVTVMSDCVEIICDVENPKWEAKQLFRFYRTQNVVGDLQIREFHAKLRDAKCDTGYCVSMGNFSDSAHKYVDGRPVDFIEKDELIKLLKKISV